MSNSKDFEDMVKAAIGNRIRELRKNLGISQEALALKADIDRTYVTSIENGKRNVSIINLKRLAIALECSLKDLFDSPEFELIVYNPILTYTSSKSKKIIKAAEKHNKKYK